MRLMRPRHDPCSGSARESSVARYSRRRPSGSREYTAAAGIQTNARLGRSPVAALCVWKIGESSREMGEGVVEGL
jgi:hypothetical protein